MVPGSCDCTQRGPCATGATLPPGCHSCSSSKDRVGAQWDLSQCPVPVSPPGHRFLLALGQCFPRTVLSSWQVSLGTPHSPALSPHFPVSCELLWSSLSTAFPVSQGSWAGAPAGPAGRPGDAEREFGGRQLWSPVPGPPVLCPAGQLCSSPRK